MVSPYILTGIVCLIFWSTYFLCARKQLPRYTGKELFVCYLFSRIVPFYACQVRTRNHLLCLVMEWVIMGLLYYYSSSKKQPRLQGTIMAFYLFQPATMCCILTGNLKGMYLVFAALAVLSVLDNREKAKNRTLLRFLPEYLIGNVGIFLWFIATQILNQRLEQITISQTEEIPGCYILSLAMMGLALTATLLKLSEKAQAEEKEQTAEDVQVEEKAQTIEKEQTASLKGIDFLAIVLLTALFAIAVFWKIGSHEAPETFETLQTGTAGENQIVLEFGEEVSLSRVSVFLGYRSMRTFSFSDRTKENQEWTVFDSNHVLQSAFAWNPVEINRKLSSLGMVLMEGSAEIREIVCLDENGNPVLPVNVEEYPNLFDEQQLYVATPSYYDQTMFDEVYHGRTAYEFLRGLSIYENTHPPLGKSIISIGIAIFGMNPFGWRFMSAVFAILMVPVFYLFAHKMFYRTGIACFSTILLETAFMNTTLGRIATIDIIVAFFVIGMFTFLYGYVTALEEKESFQTQALWLLGAGFSTAFAISTKWTGFYAAAGIAVIFFTFQLCRIESIQQIKQEKWYFIKTFFVCIVCFIGIPAVVYVLSYLPFVRFYTDKSLLQHVADNAELMLSYHADCVFEHPYSSEWYQWLIDSKPLADSRTHYGDGTVSTVMTFGNPVLCFGGLAAFVYQFYLWKTKHCKKALFLIIAYASMLLPWVFIHRTVFIYQYFVSLLLLPLLLANALRNTVHARRNMILVAVGAAALYLLYYPVLTGLTVEVDWVNRALELMESWNIA